MIRHRLMPATLLGALLLASCGDDSPAGTSGFVDDAGRPDQGDPDVGPDLDDDVDTCPAVLSAAGGNALSLTTNASADVTVGLSDCQGSPITDALVSFELEGETAGSQLQARTALTDAEGRAMVTLAAGSSNASFSLRATAPDAAPLVLTVTVSTSASGEIELTIAVAGGTRYDAFRPQLFDATTCADIGPYDLTAPLQSATSVTSTTAHPTFTDVPVGAGYAVVVLADKDLGLLGFGCTDSVTVTGGETTVVTVQVSEIPIVFTGVYALDNRLDLSEALPGSIATTLQVFDEMTDDDDLEGNVATEDFGVDPAAFLLDFVYREICCWEATGSDPDWDSCRGQAFQHPFGDLEDLYTRDFTSWDGAQPRSFGLCGSLAFGNETVMDLVQDLILENAPSVLVNLTKMAGDLSRAFTDMHITSELTIADVSLTKTGNFTHELQTMIVELHDFEGTLHVFEFELAEAGLTNLAYSAETSVEDGHVLIIPDHAFRLDFGRLLRYVYLNGLLPLLDCDPDGDGFTETCTSTGDLLATWVDCDDVGAWIEFYVSDWFTADTYAGYCRAGISLAGSYIEGQLTGAIASETTVALEGSCQAGALDERRRATELANGLWLGTIVEDSSDPKQFFGSFTGLRTGDF